MATRLGHKLGKRGRAQVTLIDATLTHLWKPLLHEVAAGTRNASTDELSYLAHAHRHHFRFRLGRLETLDRTQRRIGLAPLFNPDGEEIAPARHFEYDTLVIAIGSVTNSFGVPGVEEHCAFLDSRAQADAFHDYLLKRFLRAGAHKTSPENGHLDVAIVGAGATGVELAAELREAGRQVVAYGLDRFDAARTMTLHLIEAGPRILPALPKRVSRGVVRQLDEIGVLVYTDEQVSEVTVDGVHTASGRFIAAPTKVWAAGIRGPAVLRELDGLETNRIDQLVVKPTLQTTRDDNIFAFGDCAACPQPGSDRQVPPRAQAAHQQASLLAKSITCRSKGQPLPKYRYRDFGSLVSLSGEGTIGNLMGNLTGNVMISGRIARWIYVSLYRMHLLALHGALQTTLQVLAQWLTRSMRPRLKLH